MAAAVAMSLWSLSNLAASEREIVLVEQSKPRRQYIKKSPRWAKPAVPRKCARCGTLETPQWRKVNGLVYCNACGCASVLYAMAHIVQVKRRQACFTATTNEVSTSLLVVICSRIFHSCLYSSHLNSVVKLASDVYSISSQSSPKPAIGPRALYIQASRVAIAVNFSECINTTKRFCFISLTGGPRRRYTEAQAAQ